MLVLVLLLFLVATESKSQANILLFAGFNLQEKKKINKITANCQKQIYGSTTGISGGI